jgi:thiol-disulfide isomerase/thioredoxin
MYNRVVVEGDRLVDGGCLVRSSFLALASLSLIAVPVVLSQDGSRFAEPSTKADSPRQGPKVLRPAEQGIGRLIADVPFTDLQGQTHRLSEYHNKAALVIAFTSTSCPVCKKYAPALARLEKTYRAKNVAVVFVNPIATDDVKERGLPSPYVHDRDGYLARTLGARSTTEVFVLDAARTLVYRGAVDDQYGLGYALEAPRRTFLVHALDALLAGTPIAVAATEAPGCILEHEPAPAAKGAITYHNRISRLVQQHCLECHHRGGVAPFALETYDEVKAHKGMIRQVVRRGTMPPWFAAAGPKNVPMAWANDRSLSAADKRDLFAWLDAGLPLGDVTDAPLPRTFPKDWQIGKPDLILQMSKPIAIKAEGTMDYQRVLVETDLEEDRWVQAIEVQPTAREVTHHMLVFIKPPDELPSVFAVYVPGTNTFIYPEGFARKLPKGSWLQFETHYTPNGKATTDQTRLGLVFARKPPKYEVRMERINKKALEIPPEADNHAESTTLQLPADYHVLALMPHMHLRGKAFRYEAVLPDGTTQVLLDVPRYDFNWQLTYRYAEAVTLPRGTTIQVTGWYDNSKNNPANPDPTRTVRAGFQTYEEMLVGFMEYYVPRP